MGFNIKGYRYGALAGAFILLGSWIRLLNLKILDMRYLLELDPYVFLRYAKEIIENGAVPAIDMMRNYPLGFNTQGENLLVSYVIAWMYKASAFFYPETTLEAVAIYYPVIFFASGSVFFYLLVKDLFNPKIGAIATGILIIMPAYLFRTMAGFADKEPLGMFFMFAALYFFYRSGLRVGWRSWLNAALSGAMTGLMAMAWGGFKFLILIIPSYILILFFLGKIKKEDIISYGIWVAVFTPIVIASTSKYGGFLGLLFSSTSVVAYATLILLIASVPLRGKDLRAYFKGRNLWYLSAGAGASLIALLVTGILSPFLNDVLSVLSKGMGGDRLMMTVSEARLPFLTDWLSVFGIFFFVILLGSVYLFYRMLKLPLRSPWAGILTASFSGLIFGIIFSRVSSNHVLDGSSMASSLVLFIPVAAFLLLTAAGYCALYLFSPHQFERLEKADRPLLLVFIWLMVMLVAARSGMRLFMVLAPIASVVTAYVMVDAAKRALRMKDAFYRYAALGLMAIVIVPGVIGYTYESIRQAGSFSPSLNPQWQEAMGWVRESTPEDAVFAHWWDYGYWMQTEGGRATLTDGGNMIPYWNHLMGRHVLAAGSTEEALQFLSVHNATNLLIISDEIGKYTAYSSIGSDENFDIFSWIGTFVMDAQATTTGEGDIYNYHFTGAGALDEDFIFDGHVFPAREAYIYRIKIPVRETDEEMEVLQPVASVYHDGVRKEIPITCIYDEGIKEFGGEGFDGCLRVFPRYVDSRHIQENGALLYVSGKGREALWTRLFLFGEEDPAFRLVYDDSPYHPLIYYQGNIFGPLRIWEIAYPDNLTVTDSMREEYLSLTTPEWMNLTTISALDE